MLDACLDESFIMYFCCNISTKTLGKLSFQNMIAGITYSLEYVGAPVQMFNLTN